MGVSVQQLLIILAIIVLLFGAKKIPELANGVGKGIKSFKKEMEDDPKLEESVKKESETTKADESQKA